MGWLLFAGCVLLSWRDPLLPAADLDGSWQLATEFAARHGLVFGRDYIWNYGPFHELATRLFDPGTFPLVLFYDAFAVLAVFWTAIRNRSLAALGALALCFVFLPSTPDSLIALALFGVFLACLQRDRVWPLAFVLACGPLVLAKFSVGLVLLPLLILADVDRVRARRPPLLTLAVLVSALAAYLVAGQPLAAIGDFLTSSLELFQGYGRAMQLPGWKAELAWAVMLAAVVVAFTAHCAYRAWRDDGDARQGLRYFAALLGSAWVLFFLFKLGFVRQDLHTLVFHLAVPGALAMAFGFFDSPGGCAQRLRPAFAIVFLAALAGSACWRSYDLRPTPTGPLSAAADAVKVLAVLKPRLAVGLSWASGRHFAVMRQARAQAEVRAARTFPPSVTGTVDAIPWEAAPLIASGLRYSPRPVVQSYSSYTPWLQQRDAAHFAGPRAPDTLILSLEEIDGRLPTLALGPSLPVIGQRYDAVDADPLGLVLRRRAVPRPMSASRSPAQAVELETWVPTPAAPGRLLMAHVQVKRSLAARLVGLLYREPLMTIDLHTASGRDVSYRFVPDMAQLGVAISPLPSSWPDGAPVLLDPVWAALGEPVTAFRLVGKGWAFPGATVAFEEIRLGPGFGAGLGRLPLPSARSAAP